MSKASCGSCSPGASRRLAVKVLRRRPKASCSRHCVGRQGAVQEVLNASLDGDSDDTGKSLVTQAIGALDKDPLVSRIVEQLAERVEAVFTPQGKLKNGCRFARRQVAGSVA